MRRNNKLILYLVPFFMDVAIGMIFISIPLLAIKLGANALTLGGLGFIGGLFYVLFSLPFGKLSDHLGRKYILLSGCLGYFLSSFALSVSTQLYQLFIFMALVGVAGAMFWPSLEAWIAERGDRESLTKRVSFFNISWCAGAAVGPLMGGMLFQFNYHLPFYLAGFLSLLMAFLILNEPLDDKREGSFALKETLSKGDPALQGNFPSRKEAFSYLYAAWIANFASYFSIGMIRYLFPKLSIELNIQPFILGILLGVVALSETLVFYVLGKVSFWHYRWLPLFSLQLLGIIGLIFIFLGNSLAIFLLAFILVGAGAGMSYFSSLFYGLNDHRDRGAKSGIHEAVLGGGALFGPLAGGIFAQAYTLRTPYLVAIFVIAAGIVGEALLIRGTR